MVVFETGFDQRFHKRFPFPNFPEKKTATFFLEYPTKTNVFW